MSVTAPAGFDAAGVTAGLKKSRRASTSPSSSTAARCKARPRCSPATAAKANPIIWCAAGHAATASSSAIVLNSGGANCFTGTIGFQTTHAHRRGRRRRRSSVSRRRRARLLDRPDRRPARPRQAHAPGCSTATAHGASTRGIRRRRTGAAARDHDHRHEAEAAESVHRADRLDDRRHGQGRRACSPPASRRCSSSSPPTPCSTPRSSTRRCARPPGSPSTASTPTAACRPTTRSRLLASGASGVDARPRPSSPPRSPRLCRDLALQLQARRRGRQPRHRHRGRAAPQPKTTPSRSAAPSPATTCSRPRSSATTPTGAGCSPRSAPTATPRSTRTTSTSRSTACRSARAGEPDQPRELVDLTPRAVTWSSTCTPATATATISTNDLTHDYVEREQRVLELMTTTDDDTIAGQPTPTEAEPQSRPPR